MRGWALALVVLVVALASAPVYAQTDGRSVRWLAYDVDLRVQPTGVVEVTELQRIQFDGRFERGFRVIPTERVTEIGDVSVAELVNGQVVEYARGGDRPRTFRTLRTSEGLRIEWEFGPTTNAVRTFLVRYQLGGALRVYDEGDQLWWKAVYADRTGRVELSTITVELPAAVEPANLESALYRYRAADQIGADEPVARGELVDPRTVRFTASDLPPGTGLEARVRFPHGLVPVAAPAWQAEADRADAIRQTVAPIGNFLALLLALGILAGGGATLLLVWRSSGRDPGVGRVPPRLDHPPSDLPAPLAGTLVDEVADVQDAVATLVDLAERGILALSDEVNPRLAGSPHDARIELKTSPDDPSLRDYERTLLLALFGPTPGRDGPAVVRLSEVKHRFASFIPVVQARLHRAVADERLFVGDPDEVRRRYRGLGWGLVVAGLGLMVVLGMWLGALIALVWLPGVALAVLGFALVHLAPAMPKRTAHGALEAARWRAFRAHLLEASRASDGQADPTLVERYLPYAVAFGADRDFLHKLERIGNPAPAWYGGQVAPRGFDMPGGVVILPGGWHGGYGSSERPGVPADAEGGLRVGGPAGGGMDWQAPTANPQHWSDQLADLLNSASDALAHGGGSGGWSGGGFGGGGGGGGGSGGFN